MSSIKRTKWPGSPVKIAIRFTIAMMAALGTQTPLDAGGNRKVPVTVGRSGKRLPVWVIAGANELLKEIPSLPNWPVGLTIACDDIIFVPQYRELKAVLSPAQYEFLATRRAPAFLIGHRFPLFLVGESSDLQFFQSLFRDGFSREATLLVKALLSHEVMHVWYDPAQGRSEAEASVLTAEEYERRHEIAAYEMQLGILRRDLTANRYAAFFARITRGSIDLTTAIEERIRVLKAGAPLEYFHFFGTPSGELVNLR